MSGEPARVIGAAQIFPGGPESEQGPERKKPVNERVLAHVDLDRGKTHQGQDAHADFLAKHSPGEDAGGEKEENRCGAGHALQGDDADIGLGGPRDGAIRRQRGVAKLRPFPKPGSIDIEEARRGELGHRLRLALIFEMKLTDIRITREPDLIEFGQVIPVEFFVKTDVGEAAGREDSQAHAESKNEEGG